MRLYAIFLDGTESEQIYQLWTTIPEAFYHAGSHSIGARMCGSVVALRS